MRNNSGFSLLELSIVLVIIGLLAGGIVGGQSLVRASELRSISAGYQTFLSARNAFREKYAAIPGDMRNATRFWGRMVNAAHCVTNSSAAVATNGTCDGNGDSLVADAAAASQSGETFQFWRQLALAGMIEGSYTGLAGATNAKDYDFGTNAPESKISSVGWAASFENNSANSLPQVFVRNYMNALTIGGDDGIYADGAFLKPEEAWSLDSKLDDGKPGTGAVQAYPAGFGCNDAATNSDFTAPYTLSSTATACSLLFPQL